MGVYERIHIMNKISKKYCVKEYSQKKYPQQAQSIRVKTQITQ